MASEFAGASTVLALASRGGYMAGAMHQLVALAAYLLLAIGTTREPGHPWHEQLAYALGSAVGHVAIYLAVHALVFFGARAYRPQDVKGSFVGTRLNYLTLGLLVFFIAARMVKHSPF